MKKFLMQEAYAFRYWLLASFLLIPFVQGIRLIQPWLFKLIIDVEDGTSYGLTLMQLTAVLLAFIFVNHIFQYVQGYITAFAGARIVLSIRKKLYRHLLQLPYGTFGRLKSGQIIVRLSSDVESVGNALSGVLVRTISDLLAIVSILVVLLTINARLAMYIVIGIPCLIYLTGLIGEKIRIGMTVTKKILSEMTSFFSETIQGFEIIKSFEKEKDTHSSFHKLSRSFTDEFHKLNFYEPTYYSFVEFFTSFLLACLIFDGGNQILEKSLQFGELVAVITYVQRIMHPIRHLSGMLHQVLNAYTSMQRIFSILEEDTERDVISDEEKEIKNYSIEFKDVEFSYGEEMILKGINFTIEEGQKVAIVGRTGAGKSTIIKLINRFYLINKGEILIGGVNIDNVSRHSLRSSIGLVLQDVFLYAGSILDNLSLYDESRVKKAKEFCNKLLERGLFSEQIVSKDVGQNGDNFSIGEKQLVAFGRVFIKDAEIFLLDEATSNIDVKTEGFLEKELHHFIADKTAIIIAHRLSTIRNVDKIIVMKDGKVVETGQYQELIDKKGEFFEYFKHQYKDML
jgi:ATP-binding cassette subfamily B multidrug efflux pump